MGGTMMAVAGGGRRAEEKRRRQRAEFSTLEAELQSAGAPAAGKAANANRRPATKLYRSLTLAVAGRIVQRGHTMQACDDLSGLQDGYTAKMLHPDTQQGRIAQWDTLQLLIDALFPHGVEVVLVPVQPGAYDPAAHPRPGRDMMRLLGDIAVGLIDRSANDDVPAVAGVTAA